MIAALLNEPGRVSIGHKQRALPEENSGRSERKLRSLGRPMVYNGRVCGGANASAELKAD
jgi:hypothetical protein